MPFFKNINSIKVRYISTVLSNFFRIGIAFFTGIIIARALGPGEYGDFNFLLGSFTALAGLVNLSSSSAFFTFISQKKRGKYYYYYYTIWVLVQFFILIGAVFLLPATLREKIWLGYNRDLILFALFASFCMNKIWGELVAKIGESIRDTVSVQLFVIITMAAYFGCVIILTIYNLISIKILFVLYVILYTIISFLYGLRLHKKNNIFSQENEKFGHVFIEFKSYCLPLIIASIIGSFYSFADYWFLQKYGGSIEQGYYAIGSRFATISLIATASIISIFWKEISEAYANGNMDHVRFLYTVVVKSLFFFAAFFSCLLIPFSKEIILIVLGNSYEQAWVPFSIMLLYTIHQTLGQINQVLLQAIAHTKILSIISILFMVLSIIITYFMLAPRSLAIPGFNLGSAGLSLKMVIVQVIEVNVLSFFSAKYIKLSYNWSHQFIVLFLLLPLGFMIKYFSKWFLSVFISPHIILVMIFSGILYLITVTVLIYLRPSLVGINRAEINKIIDFIKLKFNLIF